MRPLSAKLVGLGLLCLATSCVSKPATRQAQREEACTVIARPGDFVGRELQLTGIVVTDFYHFAGISGERCQPTYIPFGPENSVHSGGRELEDAIERSGRTGGTVHLLA